MCDTGPGSVCVMHTSQYKITVVTRNRYPKLMILMLFYLRADARFWIH